MTPEPRSTRQALDWVPFEIVPDDSDRGFAALPTYPTKDRARGVDYYPLHAYSPAPTPEDGYHVATIVEIDPTEGAAITRLVIEPSPTIFKDGRHRPRRKDEQRLSPVNSSALTLIRFTDILNRIAQIEDVYVEAASDLPDITSDSLAMIDGLKKRGPTKQPARAARHAEQALDAMHKGRGYLRRLPAIYPEDWTISSDGVKKRIGRLRADGWLHREYGREGPVLDAWRRDHGSDHWTRED